MITEDPSTASTTEQRPILNRLRRAHGQLGAVIAAIESGANCRDSVTQLAAVTSALDRAGFLIVSKAMKNCLENPEAADSLTVEELEKLFHDTRMTSEQGRLLLIHAYGDENSDALETALRVARHSTERLDKDVTIQIVVQGPAVKLLSAVTTYIDDLAALQNTPSIAVLACENSMARVGIEHAQLLPGIGTVPSAVSYLAERQWEGAAYVRF